jgi:hypothetical protein
VLAAPDSAIPNCACAHLRTSESFDRALAFGREFFYHWITVLDQGSRTGRNSNSWHN